MNKKGNVHRVQPIRKIALPYEEKRRLMDWYFLNSTNFIHADTFMGLGRTTSSLVFGYFALIYSILVLFTTMLLYQRRNDPSLSKFPLWISHFTPAGMNALVVVLGFLRHMFRARYPCFLVLWTYGLLTPMYVVMIFEARSLNLIFEYHWSKRMQAVLQSTENSTRHKRNSLDYTAPIVLEKPKKPVNAHQLELSKDWYWIKKHGMISTIVGIFVFQFLMTMSIQVFSPYYRIWPKMVVYRCAGTLETLLPTLAMLMYMFVIPCYLFIQLKRINDSYSVRQDIFNAVTQSFWMLVLLSTVRHVYFIEHFVGYLPTGFAVLAIAGILHYHTVCAPLMRIYVWQWDRSAVKKKARIVLILKRRLERALLPQAFVITDTLLPREKTGRSDDRKGRKRKEPQAVDIAAPMPMKPGALPNVSKAKKSQPKRHLKGSNSPAIVTQMNAKTSNAAKHRPGFSALATSPLVPVELRPPAFNQVLQDETLCELFERYLLLEFSRENLLFYRAICSLRSTFTSLPPGAAQIFLVEKSRSIISQFIESNSPAEINIPGPIRKRIMSRIEELDIDLTIFDEAQREIFRLMQNWSYPRFLRTLPENEIRRFNRRARRNDASTTANHQEMLSGQGCVPAAAASIQIRRNSNPIDVKPASSNFNRKEPANSPAFLATSISSLNLPLAIADVSLSSSP